jgi:hypothetical protein
VSVRPESESTEDPTAEAAMLLLRSPLWSVSDVKELLEIGDAEFRRLVEADARLARVLAARQSVAEFNAVVEKLCSVCGEAFSTATFRDHCGDAGCARISRMRRH